MSTQSQDFHDRFQRLENEMREAQSQFDLELSSLTLYLAEQRSRKWRALLLANSGVLLIVVGWWWRSAPFRDLSIALVTMFTSLVVVSELIVGIVYERATATKRQAGREGETVGDASESVARDEDQRESTNPRSTPNEYPVGESRFLGGAIFGVSTVVIILGLTYWLLTKLQMTDLIQHQGP